MIGTGLVKYAKQNGLKVGSGVAYGALGGYAVTFCEGAGYKQMVIATRMADQEKRAAFEAALNNVDLTKQYRVANLSIAPNGLNVVFTDTVGTMKKIEAFVAFLLPLLDQAGADKADICNECGTPIYDDGTWVLRNGVAASHLHTSCATHLQEDVHQENETRLEEDGGSYLSGAIGALLGSLVGAVAWAIVLAMGYVAALVGLLMGFLSEKGYTLCKGKQGKAKIAIMVITIILGVLVGTVGGYVLQVVQVMQEDGMDFAFFEEFLVMIMTDSEVLAAMGKDILLGLVFAGLGVFGLLRNQNKMVSGEKITILK